MRSSFAALALASFGAYVYASPLQSRAIDDITILNFALTLEHLENDFYQNGLAKFDAKAFADAGFPPFVRGRYQQIADHEKVHVKTLTDVLAEKAVKPCTYSFPYTDPRSFVTLSQVLEGVGTSAYSGAAQFIADKSYLTVAAVILSTEARHASWIAAAVNKVAGWSGAFDAPMGLNQVFSLAAPFIKTCPSDNPPLPVKAFPTVSIKSAKTVPGQAIDVAFTGSDADGLHAVFYTGLQTLFVPINKGKVVLPKELIGTVYFVISKSATSATDENIVAGVGILLLEMSSTGAFIG